MFAYASADQTYLPLSNHRLLSHSELKVDLANSIDECTAEWILSSIYSKAVIPDICLHSKIAQERNVDGAVLHAISLIGALAKSIDCD